MSIPNANTTKVNTINHVALSRLWWVAPLAIVAASLANLIVYVVADTLFGVAWEPLFNATTVVAGTIGALVFAAAIFAMAARFAKNPIKTYTLIATIALLFSLASPLLALFGVRSPLAPQAGAAPLDTVIAMALTHITAFAVSTFIFRRLTRQS